MEGHDDGLQYTGGMTWKEALAGLLRELTGLVRDGRKLVGAQIANEEAQAEERARRLAATSSGVRPR